MWILEKGREKKLGLEYRVLGHLRNAVARQEGERNSPNLGHSVTVSGRLPPAWKPRLLNPNLFCLQHSHCSIGHYPSVTKEHRSVVLTSPTPEELRGAPGRSG